MRYLLRVINLKFKSKTKKVSNCFIAIIFLRWYYIEVDETKVNIYAKRILRNKHLKGELFCKILKN